MKTLVWRLAHTLIANCVKDVIIMVYLSYSSSLWALTMKSDDSEVHADSVSRKAIINVFAMLCGQNKHLRNNGDAAKGGFLKQKKTRTPTLNQR